MKKLNHLILTVIAITAFAVGACKDDGVEDTPQLKQIQFSSATGIYETDEANTNIAAYTINFYKGTFEDGAPVGETSRFTIKCHAAPSEDPTSPVLPSATYTGATTVAIGNFITTSTYLTETDTNGNVTKTDIDQGTFTVSYANGKYTITSDMKSGDIQIQCSYNGNILLEGEEPGGDEDKLTLEAYYFGNNLFTFTGGFSLDFYYDTTIDGENYKVGTQVMAFMPLQEDTKNIQIPTGNYTAGNNIYGDVRTFEVGNDNDTFGFRGSYTYIDGGPYKFFPQKLVTGGTFKVEDLGDGTYKFTVDFTAVEYETGDPTDNIQFEYVGELNWEVSAEEYIWPDNVVAKYHGDKDSNGNGYFDMDIFDVSTSNRFGIKISGYMNLIEDLLHPEFELGTYTVSNSGEPFTVRRGDNANDVVSGTYFYYKYGVTDVLQKAVIITGGTMTIEKTGTQNYTITTDFNGFDPLNDNNRLSGIKIKYKGDITLANYVPGEPETYQLNFTSANYQVLDNDQSDTNIAVNFSMTEGDIVYTLGIDLNMPPVEDTANISIPSYAYEPSNSRAHNSFTPGYYNEETNKYYGTCLMKYNTVTRDVEFIIITGGTASINQMGVQYMLNPQLTGTNIKTNAPVTIQGNYWGEIIYKP